MDQNGRFLFLVVTMQYTQFDWVGRKGKSCLISSLVEVVDS